MISSLFYGDIHGGVNSQSDMADTNSQCNAFYSFQSFLTRALSYEVPVRMLDAQAGVMKRNIPARPTS